MLAHSCTIFPCYLGMDNQCKDPINNNKDCQFGLLTTTMSTSLGQEKMSTRWRRRPRPQLPPRQRPHQHRRPGRRLSQHFRMVGFTHWFWLQQLKKPTQYLLIWYDMIKEVLVIFESLLTDFWVKIQEKIRRKVIRRNWLLVLLFSSI